MNFDLGWLQQQFPDLASLQPLAPPGGQKEVFSGTHPMEGGIVLKLVHIHTDPERIEREIEAVRRVQSPRVPQIREVGTLQTSTGQVLWIREQRVDGESLRQRILRGPLEDRQILKLGHDVLEALDAAEQVRIVHRDVKPENTIVGVDGSYYLLDFGLARHLDLQPLTASHGWGVGTPGYAPPEQYRNMQVDIDSRADLFALGVTLYEATEGVNPFLAGIRDLSEAVRRIEHQPLPMITRSVDATNEMRDLIHTMTRVRKDHRPATVHEAYQWMQEICVREGV